jgi:hypothetical protein
VQNLRYYFESVNKDVVVRTQYLGALELAAHDYLNTANQHERSHRLTDYDRVVLLDDPALAHYFRHSMRLPSQDVAAIGINGLELIERAHAQSIPLALTSVAFEESAALARQITNQDELLLVALCHARRATTETSGPRAFPRDGLTACDRPNMGIHLPYGH